MHVVLRAEAIRLGLSKYFTGKPCPKGHVAERWTSSSTCIACTQETRDRFRLKEQKQKGLWTRSSDNPTVLIIISRVDAKKQFLRRYYTGEPCVHGHIAERMVSNYRCVVCLQTAAKPYIYANHKKRLKTDEDFRQRQQECSYRAQRIRLENNPIERVKHSLRSRISMILRGAIKTGSAIKDLGCDLATLESHLETKFRDGMSWHNYGSVWVVDHIRPLVKFDLSVRAQLEEACHYTNLQPLLVSENASKNDKSMEEWLATRPA